jgi:hypothetical protein
LGFLGLIACSGFIAEANTIGIVGLSGGPISRRVSNRVLLLLLRIGVAAGISICFFEAGRNGVS